MYQTHKTYITSDMKMSELLIENSSLLLLLEHFEVDFAVKDKITTILTVSPSADEEISNEKLLMELVKEHFRNVGLQLLNGYNTSREILNFAESVEDPLVIMGAYGRSTISNLIIPSVARQIIENRRIPLLIAHR